MGGGRDPKKWYYCYLPNGIANGSTSPLIPLFARELGASVGQVGIVAAASSLSSVPAFVLWGSLSDKLKKRKPFVLLGFVGMALSLFLMGVVDNVPDYYLANLLLGFLGAASAPVGTVLIMETASRDEWAKRLATFSQIGGIGWVVGLVLGAVWLQIHFFGLTLGDAMRVLFMMGAALALLSALLAWRWVAEPEQRIERRSIELAEHGFFTVERVKFLPLRVLHFLDFRNHVNRVHKFSAALYHYLLCVFLLFSGFTAFYAFFPIFLADVVSLSSSQIFLVYIASQLTSAAAYLRVGRWVEERGGRNVQIIGSAARSVLFPAFLGVALLNLSSLTTFALILALHSIVGLCWAMINVSGSTLVSKLAPQIARGEALGAYNAVQGFGAIAGPVVGGLVAEFFGYAVGFLSASGFVLIGVGLLLHLKRDQ